MTKDEALKLALQALEEYTSVVTSVNDMNTWIKVGDGGKPAREAITAIKEVLAQRTWVGLDEDEFVYFCAYVNHEKLSEIENVLRDKNEQQTQ